MIRNRVGQLLDWAVLAGASMLGALAFLYPFFLGGAHQAGGTGMAHAQDAPLVFTLLVVFALGGILGNLTFGGMNAKTVAVLAVLSAFSAVLRFLPGPGGFSGIFFLPILGGYVFGAKFGFLLGSLSLLVSAFMGGGVGPWLPYQMIAAGWIGMASGWVPRRLGVSGVAVAVLTAWGALSGLLYGAVMNLWFWPFLYSPGASAMYWSPGLGLGEALRRYATFYVITSLWWDLGRAGGNAALLLLFGRPVLKLLSRFERRFNFQVEVYRERTCEAAFGRGSEKGVQGVPQEVQKA